MKRIFTSLMALLLFSFRKSFSQSCINLGCAANFGTLTADGTLADSGPGVGPGACYDGSTFKQVFWQFFYSPSGGDYTQTYTAIGGSGGDPLDLDYVVFDIGLIPPSQATCPVDPPWSQVICNIAGTFNGPTGPGVGAPAGDVLTTTALHYYAIAIVFYQGVDPTYTFTVGTPQLGGVDLDGTNCPAILLPVKLSSFRALVNNCNVSLDWTAENESGFKNYEVQSSADGKNFATIATVAAVQGTGANQKYSYNQSNPQQGKLYYRLKMVDIDGKLEYSKTIAMKLNCSKSEMLVYPNPVKDKLNVNITNAQNNVTTANLFDNYGRLIYTGKMISGTNLIDMSGFAKGIYMLTLKNNIEVQNIKIIK